MAKRFTRKYKNGDEVEIVNNTYTYGGVLPTKGMTGKIERYDCNSYYVVSLNKHVPGLTNGDRNIAYFHSSKLKDAHRFQVDLL